MKHSRTTFDARGLIALPLLLLLGFAAPARQAPVEPVTVFLVRHAEKQTADPAERDPELSEAGRERAQALARTLGQAGVTHVYCTEFVRTRATVAPLAEALALEVQEVSARQPAEQVALLRALPPGSVALVAGHSNTVPALVEALGGEAEELSEDDYDRLFVVTLPVEDCSASRALELRFGR